jgi:hypothetical protein
VPRAGVERSFHYAVAEQPARLSHYLARLAPAMPETSVRAASISSVVFERRFTSRSTITWSAVSIAVGLPLLLLGVGAIFIGVGCILPFVVKRSETLTVSIQASGGYTMMNVSGVAPDESVAALRSLAASLGA